MHIVSVNVGALRLVSWQGEYISTGIFKEPVAGRVQVLRLGLEGDRHGSGSHGGEFKAVYAYPAEHYAYWAQELNRADLSPGRFGENLTISGLREDEVHIGDVYRAGTAVLQATEPRFPCFKLGIRIGDQSVVETFRTGSRHGTYFRVLEEGALEAGDAVEFVERAPGSVSVLRAAEMYLGRNPTWTRLAACSRWRPPARACASAWLRYCSSSIRPVPPEGGRPRASKPEPGTIWFSAMPRQMEGGPGPMERAFFTMKLRPGMEAQYDANHRAVWPTVLAAIERSGIRAYSIFRDGLNLYFYVEAPDFRGAMAMLNADPEHTRWNETYKYLFESSTNPTTGKGEWTLIPEVFRFDGAGPTP